MRTSRCAVALTIGPAMRAAPRSSTSSVNFTRVPSPGGSRSNVARAFAGPAFGRDRESPRRIVLDDEELRLLPPAADAAHLGSGLHVDGLERRPATPARARGRARSRRRAPAASRSRPSPRPSQLDLGACSALGGGAQDERGRGRVHHARRRPICRRVICSAFVRPGRFPASTSPSSVSRSGVDPAEVVRARRERREHRLARLDEDGARRRRAPRSSSAPVGIDADRRDVRARRQPLAAARPARASASSRTRRRRRARPPRTSRRRCRRPPPRAPRPSRDRGRRCGSPRSARTRDTARACVRACTPVPHIASTRASSRASSRADSAEPAAVRVAVMYVPSISAVMRAALRIEDGDRRLVRRQLGAGVPLEQRHELRLEHVRTTAGTPASRRAVRARRTRRRAAASTRARSLRSTNASASASTSASRSSSASTSSRVRTSIAHDTFFSQAERLLVPRDAVRDAGALHPRAVRRVPVVVLDERVDVRLRRAPAEQPLGLRDVDERVARRRLVVPLAERRQPRELERAQRELRRPRRERAQARVGSRVRDQRLEVAAHGAELRRADVEDLAGDVGRRTRARSRRRDPRRRAAGSGSSPSPST